MQNRKTPNTETFHDRKIDQSRFHFRYLDFGADLTFDNFCHFDWYLLNLHLQFPLHHTL